MLSRCLPTFATATSSALTAAATRLVPRVARLSQGISQHREHEEESKYANFQFSPENQEKIKEILAKYPDSYKQSGIIPLLYLVQEQCANWVPLQGMNEIARVLDVPRMRVYEVATFYTMFNRQPVGKYHIQLCGTTPCQLCGAESIKAAIERHLGIKEGETTPDGLFTLSEVECLGACVNAPMIQVNNKEFYENLTPDTMVGLLDSWKNGKPVKPGPQNGQKDCEGPRGRTSLKDIGKLPPAPTRDFAKLKRERASHP